MDKETLSNYGWIVICVLVIAVMLALASPFGNFVADAIKSTAQGLFDVNQGALDVVGITINEQEFEKEVELNEYGFYFGQPYNNFTKLSHVSSYVDSENVFTFYEDESFDWYQNGELYADRTQTIGYVTYGPNTVDLTSVGLGVGQVIENGTKIDFPNVDFFGLLTIEYVFELGDGIYASLTTPAEIEIGDYRYTYLAGYDGYHAEVISMNKESYGELQTDIQGVPIVSLEDCWAHCRKLNDISNIKIPKTVKNLSWAFNDCELLTDISSLEIPEGVVDMSYAFYGTAITSANITIPNTVTDISVMFGHCENLVDVSNLVIPDSVTAAGQTFTNCTALTTLPKHTPIIDRAMFEQCTNLVNVVVPDSTKSIEERAFTGCNNIETVSIGKNVKTIEKGAFANCNKMNSLTFANGSVLQTIGDNAFHAKNKLTAVRIPSSVKTIGSYAFSNCGLSTITFDSNSQLETIGDYAFYASSLQSISIPNTVKNIGTSAFYATNIKQITIPNGVEKISIGTFTNSGLEEIIIPSTVKTIDNNAFRFCNNLTTVHFAGSIEQWQSITFGTNWNDGCDEITATCTDGTIIIPAG